MVEADDGPANGEPDERSARMRRALPPVLEAAGLAPDERALVQACRRPRTLDAHARTICRQLEIDRAHEAAVRAALGRLADRGCLVREEEILARLRTREPTTSPARIETVAFPTRGRPQALLRAVRSYAEHCLEHGRRPRLLVLDDAGDDLDAPLAALGGALGTPIAYVGSRAKRAYAERLCRHAGVDPALGAFALADPLDTGRSYGANRNAALLACAGEGLLLADDDTVCRPLRPPGSRGRLVLAAGRPPVEYWFDVDVASGAPCSESRECVPEALESLLGRDVAALAAAARPAPDLERADDAFLARLDAGVGTVVAAMPGMLGDAGGGSPLHHLLVARGDSHRRLTASPEAYARATGSRDHLRAVLAPVVNDGDYLMGTVLGLDNRRELPPFFPVHRCEDNVYGALLRRCLEGACIGHVPLALVHAPSTARRYEPGATRAPAGTTPPAVALASLAAAAPLAGRGPAERTAALGRWLAELADAPGGAFAATLRERWRSATRARARYVELCLESRPEAPAPWRADLLRYAAALSRPPETGPDDDAGTESLRRLARSWGELLAAWPALRAAAVDLQARGGGLRARA